MSPQFFRSGAEFRAWLDANHATAREIIVGFYGKNSGRSGITYAEAVDEALCFGWIDGLVRGVDENRHSRRFTPRKPKSIWSNTNVKHVERLSKEGRMAPAGIAAFQQRDAARTGIYSFENPTGKLPAEMEERLRAVSAAWRFWSKQPASYQRTVIWWLITAKKPETRQRRLQQLIATSAKAERLPMFTNQPAPARRQRDVK